jgi:hypothetical protein
MHALRPNAIALAKHAKHLALFRQIAKLTAKTPCPGSAIGAVASAVETRFVAAGKKCLYADKPGHIY